MAQLFIVLGLEASNMVQQHYTDEYNDKLLARQQQIDAEKGDLEVEQINRQNRYQYGEARAAYAGSGVNISTGSPMDELAFQISQGTFKASVARFNAMMDQENDQQKRDANNYLADQHMREGIANMASTFGNIYGRYYGPGMSKGATENTSGDGGLFDVNGSGITIPGGESDTGLYDVNGSGLNIPGG